MKYTSLVTGCGCFSESVVEVTLNKENQISVPLLGSFTKEYTRIKYINTNIVCLTKIRPYEDIG